MSEVNLKLELELAELKLKGKHFDEAERQLMSLLKDFPENNAIWYSLGITKFGFFLRNESTIEEIFYCFNKSKDYSEEKTKLIETIFKDSMDFIKVLFAVYIESLVVSKEIKNKKIMSMVSLAATGMFSGVAAASNNSKKKINLFEDFVSIGATTMAYKNYADVKEKMELIKTGQAKILDSIERIKSAITNFSQDANDKFLEDFLQECNRLNLNAIQTTSPQKTIEITPDIIKQHYQKLLKQANEYKTLSIIFFIATGIVFLLLLFNTPQEQHTDNDFTKTLLYSSFVFGLGWYARKKSVSFQQAADALKKKYKSMFDENEGKNIVEIVLPSQPS